LVGFILLLLLPNNKVGLDAEAFLAALRYELGQQTTIIVESRTERSTVPDLRRLRRTNGAQIAASVECADSECKSVRLELLGESPLAMPMVREIDFATDDPREERARAIGLVLVSIMHQVDPRAPTLRASTPTKPASHVPHHRLHALATSQSMTSDFALAWGGELGWRERLTGRWSGGLGLLGRRASINALPGTATDLGANAEVGLALWSDTRARAWNVRAILGAVVLRETLHRTATDDEGSTNDSHWKPAISFCVEASWRVMPQLSLIGRLGIENQLAGSSVRVDDRQITSLSRVQPWLAVGPTWLF
jgi:hypothetical protein